MNAATHKVEGNAKVPMLYMAPELSKDVAAAVKRPDGLRHPAL
ncbi:MAG: hypothetical protein AAB325_03455 [Pseudomonadota bacterium]